MSLSSSVGGSRICMSSSSSAIRCTRAATTFGADATCGGTQRGAQTEGRGKGAVNSERSVRLLWATSPFPVGDWA